MKLDYSPHFLRNYNKAPLEIRDAFDKQSSFLLQNLRHPSLRAKKYEQSGDDVWQARVTGDWRFYFTIENDTFYLLEIKSHPK